MNESEYLARRSAQQARVPPHDMAAEAALLGGMLLSPNAIAAGVETYLSGSDFYKPAHGILFDAIVDLYHRGNPCDPVTVADELRRDGMLEQVGGVAALVEMQTGTPAISSAGRYARIVADMSVLRRMIGVAGEIADLGYSLPDDVATVVDRAESLLFEVNHRRAAGEVVVISDLLRDALDHLEELSSNRNDVTGVPTGFFDLDRKLAGLQPGNLITIGARPAMGKTSFALNILANAAVEARVPSLLFTLEMSRDEITQRLLSADARIDAAKMKTGNLDDRDWQKITAAVGRFAEAPIFVDDNAAVTVMDIRAKARRLKVKEKLGLIVIDYLQLMTGRSRAENRQVEIAEMSRGLKILARELQVPVVMLSQLSRALESRSDKRPMLSDLRESGSVEQDSDVVMFIYRDEVYNADSADRGTAEIIVAKHRNGPTGIAHLAFLSQYTKFAEMGRGLA